MLRFKCPHCKERTISYKMKFKSMDVQEYATCQYCGKISIIKPIYSSLYFIIVLGIMFIVAWKTPYTVAFFILSPLFSLSAIFAVVFILPLSKIKDGE